MERTLGYAALNIEKTVPADKESGWATVDNMGDFDYTPYIAGCSEALMADTAAYFRKAVHAEDLQPHPGMVKC